MKLFTELIEDRISLYDFILENIDEKNILPDEFQILPDEKESMQFCYKQNEDLENINFAPGMLNGIVGEYSTNTEDIIKEIFEHIKTITNHRNLEETNENYHKIDKSSGAIYTICMENQTLSFIDDFSDFLVDNQEKIDLETLYYLLSIFLFNSTHREPIKFAIAILGLLSLDEDRIKIIYQFGLATEFAKIVSVALARQDRQDLILDLANRHSAWGKIEYIQRFEPQNDDEKLWLVTDGFRNDVDDNYLAYECIIKANLKDILEKTPILYGKLYDGIRDLLKALVSFSSPREILDDYEHKEFLVLRFLKDSKNSATSLEDLSTIVDIYDYIKYQEENESSIWDQKTIKQAISECENIFFNKSFKWKEKIKNNPLKYISSFLAPRFDVDIFDELLENAKKDIEKVNFFTLGRVANEKQFEKVIEFAQKNLPLNKMASGVSDKLGLGKEFHFHHELNFLMQDMEKYPKKDLGLSIILTALNSPVVNNRNCAMKLLEKVEYEISESIYDQIKRNIQDDPNDELVERYKDFLEKKGKTDSLVLKTLKKFFRHEDKYI